MDNIYKSIIEALIFASDEPLSDKEIIRVIKEIDGQETEITAENIEHSVASLNDQYSKDDKAFNIQMISDGYLFSTKEVYAKYIGYLSAEKSKRRLSQAALETLAIIAYKQPITKPEIEAIRGVNCDYMINTLMEKNLITMQGRSENVGRPLLYGSTEEFLKYFGLNKISDLPKPREIEEIMKDEDFLEQKRKLMMNEIEEDLEIVGESDDDSSAE